MPEVEPEEGGSHWAMLVQVHGLGTDLDQEVADDDRGWHVTPQARFERLLRETEIPAGLLFNGTDLRLVYAPPGETSGHLTFPVRAMCEVAGRPIFAALHMLLSAERLFTLPRAQRLPAILAESRKYQNLVSTKLAGQVLNALYELLRGFQAAHDQSNGALLRELLRDDPDQVYAGLLTTLLRLVFLLYAEDRGTLPDAQVYVGHYSVTGLFERLRNEDNRYHDSMNQRYGAWAQLLSLFRLVYDGASHGDVRLPPRHGGLFDPDRFPFLEGRKPGSRAASSGRLKPPKVPDGTCFRVLTELLILDGERLSYRTLDVEQIGSVYETMMGFKLEVAEGRSIALRPTKAHGAPVVLDLEALLREKPAQRAKFVQDHAEHKLTGSALSALREATTPEAAVAALDRKVSPTTPTIVPKGAMILQPTEERRRTGSHYTPRTLTEPIVRKTLEPLLTRLGKHPTPEQLLALKLCDLAMGSGAFLVETCRQLGAALVEAWRFHKRSPKIPPDEDETLHAMRLVTQQCLYGVDRNALAVDLAKLSLWLVTLARDHSFTFLDHALKHGDSLVGVTRQQIAAFNWEATEQRVFGRELIEAKIANAAKARAEIQQAGETQTEAELNKLLRQADAEVKDVRLLGDLVVGSFFRGSRPAERTGQRQELSAKAREWLDGGTGREQLAAVVGEVRQWEQPVVPFHWESEFPEVFERENPGFDGMIGNPPFAGKNTITLGNPPGYLDWLKALHEESHGNADLVAHFFRRAFGLIRQDGCSGLIATNTIRQGDTRATGLRWLCTHGGTIYCARRRLKWPGQAAVVVSVVHVAKGAAPPPFLLDDAEVPTITAFLFHAGGHEDPTALAENAGKSFQGSIVLGMGFTFDDTDTMGVASPIAEMHRLIKKDPRNQERIFPYIGGEEINSSPTQAHHRYVINFGEMTEAQARKWPDLIRIVEQKVRGTRARHSTAAWWQFERLRPELYRAIDGLERVLSVSRVGQYGAFVFLPAHMVYSAQVVVFATDSWAALATCQCQVHSIWARFFSSSLKDDLRYSVSDCFETFPFPEDWQTDPALEAVGKTYYEFRADLMVRNDEGLTATYNRVHDPNETSPDILKLRELHDAMDRAVLDAYDWTDLQPTCEFLLDYEDEEEDEDPTRPSRRRKPWRYRWPDELHDEVLARLLDLNRQRAEAEKKAPKTRSRKAKSPDNPRKGGRRRRVDGGGTQEVQVGDLRYERETPTWIPSKSDSNLSTPCAWTW